MANSSTVPAQRLLVALVPWLPIHSGAPALFPPRPPVSTFVPRFAPFTKAVRL